MNVIPMMRDEFDNNLMEPFTISFIVAKRTYDYV